MYSFRLLLHMMTFLRGWNIIFGVDMTLVAKRCCTVWNLCVQIHTSFLSSVLVWMQATMKQGKPSGHFLSGLLEHSEAFPGQVRYSTPHVSSGSPPSWTLQWKLLMAACNYNFASLQPYLCYFLLYPALGYTMRVHFTGWILICLPLEDRTHCSSVILILAKASPNLNLIPARDL